ncbi:hypothetical protein J7I93_03240 [Bacillus sp. ISL-47]|uniref:hypothetical protein n=1 Tax=Bacillus sp. ISL-47 TaxID=2819130 RepID=UPI001BEC7CF3|nr:hypothetical protein [Bacillus sp. ISL-47]MBT2687193.1 hypothetical protein [Bacillus sp. ISL-47]MBT2709793.1 hypothetical protein [Pseudomonas sp. ISL-84]
MGYTRNQKNTYLKIILVTLAIVLLLLLLKALLFSSEKQAKEAVGQFYAFEQKGEFSSSWELFHSSMKQRFSKGHYIQDRAHVFMNHFGVDTFTFTLGEPEKLNSWRMSKKDSVVKPAYKITIIQTFKGKYGNFDIEQDVYVGQEKGKWTILWDYNK